jgi:hypothetical protein
MRGQRTDPFPQVTVKPGIKWAVISLGILLFVGYVVYGSVSRTQVSCEVCLQFDGEQVCRRGAGESEAVALRAAQESTCGGRGFGMSEIIACHNRVPDRQQCTST